MQFHWDEAKRRENLRKHGLDFHDAAAMFAGAAVEYLDQRVEYGEDRRIRIAEVRGRLLVLVYTEPDDQSVRVISFRRAAAFERRSFAQWLAD